MNLTEMTARVREDLQDTDAANYRWTDDEVDGAIDRVVEEFSLAYPLQQQDDIATTEDSNELDISSLTKRLKVYSVEFPIGYKPKAFQRIEMWGSKLYMEDEGNGNDARVRWLRQHALECTVWEAATAYVVGDEVVSTSDNKTGFRYICTTAGTSGATEPTWPIANGGTVADGATLIWTCEGTVWAASTAYVVGDIRVPTTYNERKYKCTVAGTSGTTEPTWPTAVGDTVLDGATLIWTCYDARTSTIPTEHEEIIVLGATGYLAMSASAYTVDRASIAGRHATINYKAWGKERLARYDKKLKAISRANRITPRGLYAEE